MGPNLSEAQFNAIAKAYADPKRPGDVLWTKFLLDIEIGKLNALCSWSNFATDSTVICIKRCEIYSSGCQAVLSKTELYPLFSKFTLADPCYDVRKCFSIC